MVKWTLTNRIKKILNNKCLIDKGILYIKDILGNNGNFLDYSKMMAKFNFKTTFIEGLQLKSCIPTDWNNQISKAKFQTSKIPDGNFIVLNKIYISIEKQPAKTSIGT